KLFCNGAVLYGEGTWASGWTGMSGHADRGIQLWGCTNCEVHDPLIRNMANAGIAILGGTGIRIFRPRIEGTHAYSTELTAGDNFQVGIYLNHDVTYGNFDDVMIVDPDISGTTQ